MAEAKVAGASRNGKRRHCQGAGRDEVRAVTTLIMTPGVMVLIVMCLTWPAWCWVRCS